MADIERHVMKRIARTMVATVATSAATLMAIAAPTAIIATASGCKGGGDDKGNAAGEAEVPQTPEPAKPATEAPPEPERPAPPAEHFKAEHQWSMRLGEAAADAARSVAVDAAGNVYVAGYATVPGDPATKRPDNKNAVIAKLSPTGELLWRKDLGGDGADEANGIAVDGQGNAIVIGSFQKSVDFGGGPLEAAGEDDVFVLKLDAAGNAVWSLRFGGKQVDAGHAVATDSAGNVYLTGYTNLLVNFGGDTFEGWGKADLFLVKLDPAGDHVWSKSVGAKDADVGRALAVDSHDNVILVGDYHEVIDVGAGEHASAGNRDLLVAKFSPAGEAVWSHSYGGYFTELGLGVAVDSRDRVYVSGAFEDKVTIGDETFETAGKKDVVVLALDGAGALRWVRHFGSDREDLGGAVAIDDHDYVVVSGWFSETLDAGKGPLASAGEFDILLAKLSPDGDTVYARRYGNKDNDYGRALAVDAAGNTIVAGTFRYPIAFGGQELAFADNAALRAQAGDLFVVKLGP